METTFSQFSGYSTWFATSINVDIGPNRTTRSDSDVMDVDRDVFVGDFDFVDLHSRQVGCN